MITYRCGEEAMLKKVFALGTDRRTKSIGKHNEIFFVSVVQYISR
jgi:hypothetical protein